MACKSDLTLQERSKTLIELAESLGYYIAEDIEYDLKAKEKFLNEKNLVVTVKEALESLIILSGRKSRRYFLEIAEKLHTKLGNIAQPVRVAMTGKTESPGIFEVLEIVGRKNTKKNGQAIKTIEGNHERIERKINTKIRILLSRLILSGPLSRKISAAKNMKRKFIPAFLPSRMAISISDMQNPYA